MAYAAALGESVVPAHTYRLGRALMYPYFDFFACKARDVSFPRAMARFLGSLARAQQPVFSWDDPLPGIVAAAETLSAFMKRRTQQFIPSGPRRP
jgi:hypothetical protein